MPSEDNEAVSWAQFKEYIRKCIKEDGRAPVLLDLAKNIQENTEGVTA